MLCRRRFLRCQCRCRSSKFCKPFAWKRPWLICEFVWDLYYPVLRTIAPFYCWTKKRLYPYSRESVFNQLVFHRFHEMGWGYFWWFIYVWEKPWHWNESDHQGYDSWIFQVPRWHRNKEANTMFQCCFAVLSKIFRTYKMNQPFFLWSQAVFLFEYGLLYFRLPFFKG